MRCTWLMLVAGLAACSRPNPVVCCSSPADCSSLGVTDQTRPCNDGFVCIDHECANAPPADAAPACTKDSDCPASMPHCTESKICVECETSSQCPSDHPVCDSANNTCVACASDSECVSDSCNLDSGTCRSSAEVIYASPTGVSAGSCSQSSPCSLTYAVQVADGSRYVVRMQPGSYAASLTVSGKTLVLDGEGATLNAGAGGRGIDIVDGANVQITGLGIVYSPAGSGTAIACETTSSNLTPTLALRGVHTDSAATTFLANPCLATISECTFKQHATSAYSLTSLGTSTITISRSTIDGGGGVRSYNQFSAVSIVNSVLSNLVDPVDGGLLGTGLGTGGGGSLVVSYSTIVNSPLRCGTGVPGCAHGGTPGVCIDNSILLTTNGSEASTGSACQLSYSIAYPQNGAVTGANNKINVDPQVGDATNGDYHLKPSSPAIDAADPSAPNSIDFGGTARPQGARNDIGAYEFKP